MLRFSKASYDETGLRDIAADVGCDVAYVHRCFGSKERLFAEVVGSALQSRRFLAVMDGDLPAALARRAFARRGPAANEVAPLDIIIRSLLSPDAAPVLRDYLDREFVAPLSDLLERPAEKRAALIAAIIVGVGILRNVVKLKPLLERQGGLLESLVSEAITTIIDTNAGSGSQRKD